MRRIVILGAGGQARELFDLLADARAEAPHDEVLGWLVEPGHGELGSMVRDRPILGDPSWLRGRAEELWVVSALGDPALRRRLVALAAEHGARFCNAVHPRAVLSGPVVLGRGVVIGAGTVVTGDVRLGDHVLVNTGCTLSHDTALDDFATLSPGVHLAGGVRVGEGAFLGTGANVLPRVRIGARAVVGAGCVVLRDVPDHTTVAGVPGRVIQRRGAGFDER